MIRSKLLLRQLNNNNKKDNNNDPFDFFESTVSPTPVGLYDDQQAQDPFQTQDVFFGSPSKEKKNEVSDPFANSGESKPPETQKPSDPSNDIFFTPALPKTPAPNTEFPDLFSAPNNTENKNNNNDIFKSGNVDIFGGPSKNQVPGVKSQPGDSSSLSPQIEGLSKQPEGEPGAPSNDFQPGQAQPSVKLSNSTITSSDNSNYVDPFGDLLVPQKRKEETNHTTNIFDNNNTNNDQNKTSSTFSDPFQTNINNTNNETTKHNRKTSNNPFKSYKRYQTSTRTES
eukprot:UN34224